jgi:hypothetical protein
MAQEREDTAELARAQAALRRSVIRLKVARRRKRSRRPGQPPGPGETSRIGD